MTSAVVPDDAVVVAGMAIEAPGGIDTVDGFWDALLARRTLLSPLPTDRGWSVDELTGLGDREGWMSVPDSGGFLDGAADFDPGLFGVSPREATAMDPQQRVALRVTWRALQSAGEDPNDATDRQDAGCFMGVNANGYGPSMARPGDHNGHLLAGTSLSGISGRVSHCLGLGGPSMSIDTGCAASLTAVHQAANAVRWGECAWAVAGGVTVMGSPMMFVEFAKNHALAADGTCRPYAEGAGGTVWSEGAGIVLVERAERARRLGHRIHGVIAAGTTNHNAGRSGITVPDRDGQRDLITRTLTRAGIDPAAVDVVEGHGTGTRVGDPIELNALADTYGAAHTAEAPVRVGSAKSNLGHTQAAAGVIGLIKVLLSGEHATVAPTLHADPPSTAIDWERSGLAPAHTVTPWRSRDGLRHAAVSAFGITGHNTHLVVTIPDPDEPLPAPDHRVEAVIGGA